MAVKMEDMDIVPMTDALARLSYFRARNVRQTTLFRGPLDIAGEAFQVPIYVYSRTAEARAVRLQTAKAGGAGRGRGRGLGRGRGESRGRGSREHRDEEL